MASRPPNRGPAARCARSTSPSCSPSPSRRRSPARGRSRSCNSEEHRPVTDANAATYRLTEEQVLLRDTIRELATDHIAPRAADIDRNGEFPEDIRQLLTEHDVLALPYPTE